MKKIIVCLLAVLVSSYAVAQEKPFLGYGKVKWGTSIAGVRKAYGIKGKLKDADEPGNKYLVQDNVSKSIQARYFVFGPDGKLGTVNVEYNQKACIDVDTLLAMLQKKYDSYTQGEPKSETTKIVPGAEVVKTTTFYTFEHFLPDIKVKVEVIRNKLDADELAIKKYSIHLDRDPLKSALLPNIIVYYSWPKYWDNYETSKIQL